MTGKRKHLTFIDTITQRNIEKNDCCLMLNGQFFSCIVARTSYSSMRWWCCLLCTWPTLIDLYCSSSLKQQSAGRRVSPLRHIILILSQPVFILTAECCMLRREAANTNVIVFGLIC